MEGDKGWEVGHTDPPSPDVLKEMYETLKKK